jgi:hypothetical protein
MTGLLYSNFIMFMMIGEVNRKKPDEGTISYFGFTYGKLSKILTEYRHLYPQGKLHLYWKVCLVLAFSALAGVLACLMIRFR